MSRDRRLDTEMRRQKRESLASDRYPLDENSADRLLAGDLAPAEAPGPYSRVAQVFAVAAAPPRDVEIAGEDAAVAAFRAARRSAHAPAPSRRRSLLTKFLGAKAAALAVAGAVSVGGVAAAATGSLPTQAQQAAHDVLGGLGVPSPDASAASDDHSAARPAGAGAAGLCRAWSTGEGGEHGKKLDATAFDQLATAAGGADGIADYCAAQASSKPSAHSTHAAGAPAESSTTHGRRAPGARPTGKPAAQSAEAASLCRGWAADQGSAAGGLNATERERLIEVAGGHDQIADFCRSSLAGDAAGSAASHATATQPVPTQAPGRS
jgi:hypothetical protein